MGVFALQIPAVHAGAIGVLPEVRKPQQRADAHAPEARQQSAFGRVEAVGIVLFGAAEVHLVVYRAVIGLLIDAEVVRTGLMHLFIFFDMHRIHLNADA